MFKLIVFVLIPITLIFLGLFIDGLMDLYKKEQEDEKNVVREGMEGYLDQAFGNGAFKIFKSIFDSEGNEGHLVYLSKFEWFKSPTYKWYEVFETNNGFHHYEIER